MTLPYLQPLETAALRDLQIPEPWSFGIPNRVVFSDLDALGHVNNATFFSWFENTRLPYLRAMEVTDYGPASPRLVLAEVGCIYRVEMLLDQDYVVTARTRELGESSFTMDYAVFALTGDAAVMTVEAHAVIVLRTRDGTGKYPISDRARAILSADGAVPRPGRGN